VKPTEVVEVRPLGGGGVGVAGQPATSRPAEVVGDDEVILDAPSVIPSDPFDDLDKAINLDIQARLLANVAHPRRMERLADVHGSARQ
jgi:hypothetical protein